MPRDYLMLTEIEEILENYLNEDAVEEIMKEIKEEAESCLCAATCHNECLCGAWEFGEGGGDD